MSDAPKQLSEISLTRKDVNKLRFQSDGSKYRADIHKVGTNNYVLGIHGASSDGEPVFHGLSYEYHGDDAVNHPNSDNPNKHVGYSSVDAAEKGFRNGKWGSDSETFPVPKGNKPVKSVTHDFSKKESTEMTGNNLKETAAADSLSPNSAPAGAANKAWSFSKVVNAMAGMDQETINKFVEMIGQIGHEADSIGGGAAAANKATIDAKPSDAAAQVVSHLEAVDDAMRAVISEDISNLFEGDELSEEFKTKVSVVIESAINMKVAAQVVALEEAFDKKLQEQVDHIAEDLVGTLELAVDAIAESWLENNEVAVVSTLRSDLTEQFLEDLRGLFETHYIEIPDDKIDVLEEQAARIEELEELASDALEENLSLRRTLEEAQTAQEIESTIEEAARGMSMVDAEKLRELVESVDYTSPAEFKKKVGVLKETHFKSEPARTDAPTTLFEETNTIGEESEEDSNLSKSMAAYVRALQAQR